MPLQTANWVCSSSKEETEYKLDLGDVWTEADVKGPLVVESHSWLLTTAFNISPAKQIINDKVVPLYNSTIEQAVAFKDSPEAVQLQEYLKSKSTELLSQIYPMAPFKLNGKPSSDDPADENKWFISRLKYLHFFYKRFLMWNKWPLSCLTNTV